MYGTIAHLKVLPGRREELGHLFDDRPVPVVSGWIANYLFEVDGDPDHAIFFAIFDDRETYRANADSASQNERYQRLRALLIEDAQWNDGEINPYMSFRQPAADATLYGTVAHLPVAPGLRQTLNDYMESRTVFMDEVPGMLAGYLLFAENDPDLVLMAGVFDSPDSYRANSANPDQHARYLKMRALLTGDPEWFDGYVTPYLRF
jgi:hypothetical protein